MSPKTLFSVILLILFVDISVFVSGETTPQPDNDQSEDKKRAEGQREIKDIMRYLKKIRKFENSYREFDKFLRDEVDKEQSLKDQKKLDELEPQLQEVIDDLQEVYENRLPLGTEYNLKVTQLQRYNQEIKALTQRIYNRRIPVIRSNDIVQSQFIKKKVNARRELEDKFSVLELPPKYETAKKQRKLEQEQLIYVEQKLQKRLQSIEKWHANNRSLNDEYSQLLKSIKQNFKNFIIITSQIDQRRMQERLSEGQHISKIKEYLKSHRQYELKQRKEEKPANSDVLLERKKDEFIEDRLDKWLHKRIISMEERLAENNLLDKDYAHQKDLLNRDFEKFVIHLKKVEIRRAQENFQQ